MAEVTFKFNEDEDREDINIIINRHKLVYALNELQNYRRSLYKGYEPGLVIIKDNKVVCKDNKQLEEYNIEGTESLIRDDDIIKRIDNILENVIDLIDY